MSKIFDRVANAIIDAIIRGIVAIDDTVGLLPEDEMNYAEMMFARLPVGWECEASGRFFFEIFNATEPVPEHGWKVRINTHSLKSFPSVLGVVSKICFPEGIPMKVAKSPAALRQLHAKNISIEIAGKAITLYPGSAENVLIDLIDKLEQPLKSLSLAPANAPWSDRRIGANISYRYGSYRPQSTLRIAGDVFRDRRDAYILPSIITDPFPAGVSSGAEVPEVVRFNDYEISSVLHRNFGGSVYGGISLRTNEAIILKEARPEIRVACEVAATSLLENEHRVLKTLSKSDIAPVPIDDLLDLNGHLFLILPRISGQNLFHWLRSHGADEQRCARVARQLVAKLTRLHERGTSHGDISRSNILIGRDDSVSLIDFENARLDADADDFAEDAMLLSKILGTLLGLNSKYRAAISLAEEGGRMSAISDRLNDVD